jgi:hypothetical protein
VEQLSSYSKRWKEIAEQEKREARAAARKKGAAGRDKRGENRGREERKEQRAREERLAASRERTRVENELRATRRALEEERRRTHGIPWWGWVIGTLVVISLLTGKPILSGCSEPNRTPEGYIICNDGWVSPSEGSGTCSHHGGISYGNGDPGP